MPQCDAEAGKLCCLSASKRSINASDDCSTVQEVAIVDSGAPRLSLDPPYSLNHIHFHSRQVRLLPPLLVHLEGRGLLILQSFIKFSKC